MLGLLRHTRSHYVFFKPNFLRLLSSAQSTSTQQQSRSNPATYPPPLHPRTRKHKLDIRPIKNDGPKAVETKSKSTLPTTPGLVELNPIDTAKLDIQSATAHGILLPPPVDSSWARKLMHQGRELFKFYWNGLKLIYTNRKMALDIKHRAMFQEKPMTRWESVFVKTNKQDLLKLIPFVVILLILEEALPLFVLYAPFLLPSTCLLVSQRNRIMKQRADKNAALVAASLPSLERAASAKDHDLKLLCGVLSLPTVGPTFLRRKRLVSHLEAIQADDQLLLREAFDEPSRITRNLSKDEVFQVLSDRGFMTTQFEAPYARDCLVWYYSQPWRNGDPSERLALVAKAALFSMQHESVQQAKMQ